MNILQKEGNTIACCVFISLYYKIFQTTSALCLTVYLHIYKSIYKQISPCVHAWNSYVIPFKCIVSGGPRGVMCSNYAVMSLSSMASINTSQSQPCSRSVGFSKTAAAWGSSRSSATPHARAAVPGEEGSTHLSANRRREPLRLVDVAGQSEAAESPAANRGGGVRSARVASVELCVCTFWTGSTAG